MPSPKPVINFVIDPELLQHIEDFRFAHRFGSRAAAMKWLIAAGLDQGPQPSIDNRDHRDRYLPRTTRSRKT